MPDLSSKRSKPTLASVLFAAILLVSGSSEAQTVSASISPPAGEIHALATDPRFPDLLWAGSSAGQVFKSTDRGQTWRHMLDMSHFQPGAVSSIVIDPSDPDIVLAFACEGYLAKTLDGGETWTDLPPSDLNFRSICGELLIVPGQGDPYSLLLHQGDSLAVSLTGGGYYSWRSADEGLPSPVKHVAIHPSGDGFLFAVTGRRLFRTAKLGEDASWRRVDLGVANLRRVSSVAVAPSDPKRIYAFGTSDGLPVTRFVATSSDGGTNWTVESTNLTPSRVVVDAFDPSRLYATAPDLRTSDDGGRTFVPVEAFSGLLAFAASQATPGLAFASAPQVRLFESDDFGGSWRRQGRGLPSGQIADLAVVLPDPLAAPGDETTPALLAASGPTSYRSLDLVNWVDLHRRIDALAVSPVRPRRVYGTNAFTGDLLLSDDGGRSWQTLPEPDCLAATSTLVAGVPAAPGGPEVLVGLFEGKPVVGCPPGGLAVSLDGGASFDPVAPPTTAPVRTVEIHPRIPGQLYVGTTEGLYLSSDFGTTWTLTDIGDGPPPEVTALAVDRADAKTLYAATPLRLWKSTDHGLSWQRVEPYYLGRTLGIVARGSRVFAAIEGTGISGTVDGGLSWPLFEVAYLVDGHIAWLAPNLVFFGLKEHGIGATSAKAFPAGE